MRTEGRKFELFYSNGGHGGPYQSIFTAARTAARLLKGSRTECRIVVRDRAKLQGQPGYNVLTAEKTKEGEIVFAR